MNNTDFMRFFAISGMIVFSLVAASTLYNTIISWAVTNPATKTSSIAMTFFYCVLVGVFVHQYKGVPKLATMQGADIEKIIKGAK